MIIINWKWIAYFIEKHDNFAKGLWSWDLYAVQLLGVWWIKVFIGTSIMYTVLIICHIL